MDATRSWALTAILTTIFFQTCILQNVPERISKDLYNSEKIIGISKLMISTEPGIYSDEKENTGIQKDSKEDAPNYEIFRALNKHNSQDAKEPQEKKVFRKVDKIYGNNEQNQQISNKNSERSKSNEKHDLDALPLSIEAQRGTNVKFSQQPTSSIHKYRNRNDPDEISLKDFESFPSKRQTEWATLERSRTEAEISNHSPDGKKFILQRETSYTDENNSYLPMSLSRVENRQETPVYNGESSFNIKNFRGNPTPKYSDEFTEPLTDSRKAYSKSGTKTNFQKNYESAYDDDPVYDVRPPNERRLPVIEADVVPTGRTERFLRDEEETRRPEIIEDGKPYFSSDSIYCREPAVWRQRDDTPSRDKAPGNRDEENVKNRKYWEHEETRQNDWDVRRPEEPDYDKFDNFKDQYIRSNDNSSRSIRENHSAYSGFPESYQTDISHHYSKPLQYEPIRAFPASPCNTVFKYEGREPEEDKWYGNIYISTDEVLNGIRLDVTLDRTSELLTNWLADVKTKDNIHFTILSLTHKLVPGPPETVRIMVKFNGKKQIPFLKSINLNGRLICPSNRAQKTTTRKPVYENPGDLQLKRTTTGRYTEPSKRPLNYVDEYESNTKKTTAYVERRTTSAYEDDRKTVPRPTSQYHQPNPNGYEETDQNTFVNAPAKKPHGRPAHSNGKPPPHAAKPAQGIGSSGPHEQGFNKGHGQSQASNNKGGNRNPGFSATNGGSKEGNPNFSQGIECGTPSVQPSPLITHGQHTSRGQWPWHVALYKNVGTDLTFFCGGSLINNKYVLTAAHCVTKTYTTKPLDENTLVVYLGKYHLKLWSEGGVQNRQVTKIYVHSQYNSTDFRSDIAVLALSSPVEYSDFVRPICLWDRSNTRIEDVEGKLGTVVGWGFDENKMLTEELRQAKMPVVEQKTCLWSYPDFYPQFTSNMTYCAGFKNGTSVCNGDSGGGMVFPFKDAYGVDKWYLRGIVSISPARNDSRVCDTSHYVIFTDVAKYLPWLANFV